MVWGGSILLFFWTVLVFVYGFGKDNANSAFYKESIALYNENKEKQLFIEQLNDSIGVINSNNQELLKDIERISHELPDDKKENIIGFYNTLKKPVEINITIASHNKPYSFRATVEPSKFFYHRFEYANYLYTLESGGVTIKENELIRFHAAGRIRLIAIK